MSDEELIKSLEERTNRLGIDIKAAVTSHQPLGHIATWPHCNMSQPCRDQARHELPRLMSSCQSACQFAPRLPTGRFFPAADRSLLPFRRFYAVRLSAQSAAMDRVFGNDSLSFRGVRSDGRIEAFPAFVTKQSARGPRNGSQRPTLRDRIDECQGMTSFSTASMIAKRSVAMTEMVTRTAKTRAVSI